MRARKTVRTSRIRMNDEIFLDSNNLYVGMWGGRLFCLGNGITVAASGVVFYS